MTHDLQIDFHKQPWINVPDPTGFFPGYNIQYDCKDDVDYSPEGPVDITFSFANAGQGPDGNGFSNPSVTQFAFRPTGGKWVLATDDQSKEFYVKSRTPFTVHDKDDIEGVYDVIIWVNYAKNDGYIWAMGIDPKIHNQL